MTTYDDFFRPYVDEVNGLRSHLDGMGIPYETQDWKSHQMKTTWSVGDREFEQYLDLSNGYGRIGVTEGDRERLLETTAYDERPITLGQMRTFFGI